MKYWLIFFFCLCSFSASAALKTEISPQQGDIQQIYRLTITVENLTKAGTPKLSALEKDFDIVGTQQNTSYSMINGQANASTQWIILLKPLRTGRLNIPSIPVGQAFSEPLSIEVSSMLHNNRSSMSSDADSFHGSPLVLVESKLEDKNPYVNQQMTYCVKIYMGQRAIDFDFKPPDAEHALWFALGKGKAYQDTKDGVSYAVEEQCYAIFAQKSGLMQISKPVLSVLLMDHVPRRVTAKGNQIDVDVRPEPPGISNWLPANKVTVSSAFSQDLQSVHVGDVLDRIVNLEVTGAPAQLLSKLKLAEPVNISVYPKKPTLSNRVQDKQVIGIITLKASYVIDKPGQLVIPEQSIPWFNIQTGKQELAVLPAQHIQVLSKNGNKSTIAPKSDAAPKVTSAKIHTSKTAKFISAKYYFGAGFILLFIVLIFLFNKRLFSCLRYFKSSWELKHVCNSNNAKLARDRLIKWANCKWTCQHFHTTYDILDKVEGSTLADEIRRLHVALYDGVNSWLSKPLVNAALCYRESKHKKKTEEELPSLHKILKHK